MFAVRGLNGEMMFDTETENNQKEMTFETYDEAKKSLENLEQSLPKIHFKIVALNCDRCCSDNDVAVIHVDDEPKAFCQNCRVEIFAKKKSIGRPALGVTKKISVTLSESDWEWLDEKAQGNRSAFVRETILSSFDSDSEWNNNACLGYAIKALGNLNYGENEIEKIVRAIYATFDMTSVSEAKKVYENSPY